MSMSHYCLMFLGIALTTGACSGTSGNSASTAGSSNAGSDSTGGAPSEAGGHAAGNATAVPSGGTTGNANTSSLTSAGGTQALGGAAGLGGVQTGSGGTLAVVGSQATGGALTTSGKSSTGGARTSAGTSSSGGSKTNGGGTSSAGGTKTSTGGASSTGGKSNGGASSTGGAPANAGTSSSGGTSAGGSSGAGPEQCTGRAAIDSTKWRLAWSDEFDKDGAPNSTNWGFEKGFVRNQELQWYQPDNATVSNGLLTIAAQKQQVKNPNYNASSSDWKLNRQYADYTSSSLVSSGKQSFLYGRFEMCGQIDTRQGSWPAFWVLGNGRSWPSSGEVDIMEYYNNGVRANICKPSGSNCDWSGSVSQSLSSLGGSTWSSKFHLWAMEWDSKSINLYLDDKLVYGNTIASADPYTGNPFYILVNLAIGANGGDPSSTTFPITYQVDYVRVYQKP